jgi:type I restriction enzyme S subunit
MSEWKQHKLGEVLESANTGLDAIKRAPIVAYNTGVKCLRIQDISQDKKYNDWGFTQVLDDNFNKFKLLKNDIIVARTGATVGVNLIIKSNLNSVFNNGLIRLRVKDDFDSVYISYLLKSSGYWNHINSIAFGTTSQPNIQINQLLDYRIKVPNSKATQRAIAEILSSLDDKIELNNKINQELETLAQTLFRQWFIDFEFPNENSEPYKSSGGEMVESELGEIPKGWEVNKLNDIADCFDNKRIPLSSMERNVRKGNYPYYGAASLMDFIDDYLFDGVYILMGEDGSVTDNKGYPVLQYVFGKFWVNNHAHVLKGRKISTELILCLLKNTNISDLVTGAVQPKLNQGNMNKISIPLPQDLLIISDLEKLITDYYNLIRINILEIKELTNLRDTLLPKLISGELEINEINN